MAKMISKTERLETRLSGPVKDLLQQAASLTGQSLTDFVIAAAATRARQVVHENDMLELGRGDQARFVQALLEPASANTKLRKAASKYLQEL
jgi:uncharacterized protein (DUF1778 family)